jgi:peptidoglycan biosynthesis protein MviN/MurJ (putative lipid II flippase)
MIASMLNSIVSLAFLFCFQSKLGILSLLLGLMVSYILQLCFLMYLMIRVLRWRFTFKVVRVGSQNVKNIIYALTGDITTTLSTFIPAYLLSGFGLGIISSLNYGQRVANLPEFLITAQFSSVAAIKFNELYSRKELKQLNNIFVSSAKTLAFILVPASFFIFIWSSEIVTVLFKRGAFDENSVKISAVFLKYLALLIPMMAVNTLVARLFMAAQKIRQAFWYQAAFNISLITAIFIFTRYFGAAGYLYSLVLLNFCNVIALYYMTRYFFPMIDYKQILSYMIKIVLLNLPICAVLFVIKIGVFDDLPASLNLIFGFIAYLLILFLINAKFHINRDVHDFVLRCIEVFRFKTNLIKS